ncbi:hypothetical protein ACUWC2_28290 [Klebsiella pneumoniae]|uniref:hypothetical protein n=1 Tax=Klebsiella pneumoniae TaxID=573 RepID=UPI0040559A70
MIKSNNKIVQVNLHHAKGASSVLCERFTKNNFKVAMIQEPWINKGKVAGLNIEVSKLIYHNLSIRPRTAILIKDLNFCPLTEFISEDLVAVKVEILKAGRMQEVVIASAYFPGVGKILAVA